MNQDLFSQNSEKQSTPLANSLRPSKFNDFVGQTHLFKKFPYLLSDRFPHLILWGPPGSGKTTLAYLLADNAHKKLFTFNAVLGGVTELRKIIQEVIELRNNFKKDSIIFIDEIHRFNKSQQDALLPHLERGDFTLIGATTENPRIALNKALCSRLQTMELYPLELNDLEKILLSAVSSTEIKCPEEVISFLAKYSNGDARMALNYLEIIINRFKQNPTHEISLSDVKSTILENARQYDKSSDRHYDVISAFIKSMRGSDPNAAVLWLAVMLEGGEDPVFIARRMVVFASEDIGNADPSALNLAISALVAAQNIGMPEVRINLSQVAIYLASTFKSNASYKAINESMSFVLENPTIEVPNYLKSRPRKDNSKTYDYPHDFPNHYVKQDYTINSIPEFYRPTAQGKEKLLKEHLQKLKGH